MQKILVIGGTHLDVVAEYDVAYEHHMDKPGRSVEYSIGGAAFNIASNISRFALPGVEAKLVTCLKEDSLSGFLIREALERAKVSVAAFISDENYPESGYIAHWSGGHLSSAVSCSNLEHAEIRRDDILVWVKGMDVVAIDTNLTESQIKVIRTACHQLRKPLLVGCVAEGKVHRIKMPAQESGGPKYALVSMNEFEARSYFGEKFEDRLSAGQICQQAHAKNVLITKSSQGFVVYSSAGTAKFPAPTVNQVVSELGAGDALFSACCEYFVRHRAFHWDDCYEQIKRYVVPILRVRQATIDASKMPNIHVPSTGR